MEYNKHMVGWLTVDSMASSKAANFWMSDEVKCCNNGRLLA
jgi:hypothetical protein